MSLHTVELSWNQDEDDHFSLGRYTRVHEIAFDGGVTIQASASPSVVREPFASAAAIPLRIRNHSLGVLFIGSPNPRQFDECHKDFMYSLGDHFTLSVENLRLYEERSELARMEERNRVARDLHDSVSQQLFALHMSASSLPKLLELNPEHANKVMEQLIAMSSTAQRQMRGLIAQLRPMELQGRTLCEAMDRWFPDYCRQNGLQGTLDLQLRSRLPEAMEHQLFLIVQEAMGNVVKHAEATNVRLYLGETDSQVVMNIEDDGTGFRSEQVRTGAYGLSTMRERAQKLGGEAEIMSKPGAGTKVKVWFPIFGSDNHDRSIDT